MERKWLLWVYLVSVLLLLCLTAGGTSAEDEVQYIENEWNFVDRSMDVSHGIPEDATGVLEKIRRTRTLRVATEPYFPPQEFIDPTKIGRNRFAGSDIELAYLIADHMGATLEIVPMDFADVLPAVADGTCDLAISALSYTPERAMMYELSRGYYYSDENAGSGILVREAQMEVFRSIEDFSDKIIAAQSGSVQESLMAENFRSYREFIRLNSLQDIINALKNGKVDGALVNIESALSYIEDNPDCGLALLPDIQFFIEDEQYLGDRIAAKKGQIQLIYFVNGVIEEVLESGQYLEWYQEAEELADSLGL